MSDLLKGKDGETSSKRVGFFIMIAGILIVAGMGIYKDPTQAAAILWPLVSLAGVCAGATAVERMGK